MLVAGSVPGGRNPNRGRRVEDKAAQQQNEARLLQSFPLQEKVGDIGAVLNKYSRMLTMMAVSMSCTLVRGYCSGN